MKLSQNNLIAWKPIAAFLMLCIWVACRSACILSPIVDGACCPVEDIATCEMENDDAASHHESSSSESNQNSDHSLPYGPQSMPCCEDLVYTQSSDQKNSEFRLWHGLDLTENEQTFYACNANYMHLASLPLPTNLSSNLLIDLEFINWILVECGHPSIAPPHYL